MHVEQICLMKKTRQKIKRKNFQKKIKNYLRYAHMCIIFAEEF